MADDDLEVREVAEDVGRAEEGPARHRLLLAEVAELRLAGEAERPAVDQGRGVQLDEHLVDRVPVIVSERRKLDAAFTGVRVELEADGAQLFDAALHLLGAIAWFEAGALGQRAQAHEAVGVEGSAAGDQVVHLLSDAQHDDGAPLSGRDRPGSSDDKLQVRPDRRKLAEMILDARFEAVIRDRESPHRSAGAAGGVGEATKVFV